MQDPSCSDRINCKLALRVYYSELQIKKGGDIKSPPFL